MNTYMRGAGMSAADSQHLDDDDLLRFIDNDGDDAWRAHQDRHLASCEACAGELEALSADAALFRLRLDEAAFDEAAAGDVVSIDRAPSRQRAAMPRTAWLRAAAILLMVAAPVAAFPGLRAWIADSVGGPSTPAADVRTMSAPAAMPDDVALIRFAPAAGLFAVVVDAAQQDGVLRVSQDAVAANAMFETQPVAGETPAEPVVAEGSLRLRNDAGATASYTLVLPAGTTRVTVTVGGVMVADLAGAALRDGADIPLRLR